MNIFAGVSVDSVDLEISSFGLIAITSDQNLIHHVHNVSPDIHKSTYAELFTADAALELLLKIIDRHPLVTLYSNCHYFIF